MSNIILKYKVQEAKVWLPDSGLNDYMSYILFFSCDNGDMSQIVDTSSEEDFVNGHTNGMNGKSAPFMHELTDYYKEFEKLHLVS